MCVRCESREGRFHVTLCDMDGRVIQMDPVCFRCATPYEGRIILADRIAQSDLDDLKKVVSKMHDR